MMPAFTPLMQATLSVAFCAGRAARVDDGQSSATGYCRDSVAPFGFVAGDRNFVATHTEQSNCVVAAVILRASDVAFAAELQSVDFVAVDDFDEFDHS